MGTREGRNLGCPRILASLDTYPCSNPNPLTHSYKRSLDAHPSTWKDHVMRNKDDKISKPCELSDLPTCVGRNTQY
eukprot:1203270-Rhodomonas_salina.2